MLYFTIFPEKSAKFSRDYFFAHPGFRLPSTSVVTVTDIRLKFFTRDSPMVAFNVTQVIGTDSQGRIHGGCPGCPDTCPFD